MEALYKLGIDYKLLIAQIINFGILFFLLRHFLYKPILGILDRRQKRIKESLDKAADIDKKSQDADKEYKERLAQANRDAAGIVEEARKNAEKLRKEILESAEKEADDIRAKANFQIVEERKTLYADVKKNAAKLAIFIVTKILKQDFTEEMCRKSVDRALMDSEVNNLVK